MRGLPRDCAGPTTSFATRSATAPRRPGRRCSPSRERPSDRERPLAPPLTLLPGVERASAVLNEAIGRKLFPCAVAEVGDAGGVRWRASFGACTFDSDAPAATDGTCFDL